MDGINIRWRHSKSLTHNFKNKTKSEANASLFFVIVRKNAIKILPLFLLLVFTNIV